MKVTFHIRLGKSGINFTKDTRCGYIMPNLSWVNLETSYNLNPFAAQIVDTIFNTLDENVIYILFKKDGKDLSDEYVRGKMAELGWKEKENGPKHEPS